MRARPIFRARVHSMAEHGYHGKEREYPIASPVESVGREKREGALNHHHRPIYSKTAI